MGKAYLLVICLLVTSFTGCIIKNDSSTYEIFEVWSVEGDFAPDPGQDEGAAIEAVETLIENPLQFQQAAHNVSWQRYEHNFVIESTWEVTYVVLFLTVDYELSGGEPSEGPAGTLNISIKDPGGGEHAEGYEMVTWNNDINERPYMLPSTPGIWTIVISGSGLEGIGSIAYSGNYSIRVETEGLV